MIKQVNNKSKRLSNKENNLDEADSEYFNDFNYQLWVVFDQAGDVVSKAREMELNQCGLTKAQAVILHRFLNSKKGFTLAEITKWSAKESSSVLNLINRMQKNGLVEKTKINKKTTIHITQRGRDLFINATRDSIDMIFSGLAEDEKQQLLTSVEKIRNKARQLLGIDFKPAFLK
jgi:DNA-binding MarR family transcriptional regulator